MNNQVRETLSWKTTEKGKRHKMENDARAKPRVLKLEDVIIAYIYIIYRKS